MSKNIHFDENFQIRALDPEMHAHSAKTEAEAKEFMDRAWHRRFSYTILCVKNAVFLAFYVIYATLFYRILKIILFLGGFFFFFFFFFSVFFLFFFFLLLLLSIWVSWSSLRVHWLLLVCVYLSLWVFVYVVK
jgi:hypothetical protein